MFVSENVFVKWILDIYEYSSLLDWSTIDNAIRNKLAFKKYFNRTDTTTTNKIKGDLFEYVIKYLLLFQGKKYVYLFNEIPDEIRNKLNQDHKDRGLDIICSDDNKEWIGIQCKWRDKNCSLKRCVITDFLYELSTSHINSGIIATNCKYATKNFENTPNLKWYIQNTLILLIDKQYIEFIRDNSNVKTESNINDKHKNIKTESNTNDQHKNIKSSAMKKLSIAIDGKSYKFVCSKCSKGFDRKSSYDRHVNRKNPCVKHELRCQYCKRTFKQKAYLKKHLLKCNILAKVPKFHCDYCSNYFASKYSLQRALLQKL